MLFLQRQVLKKCFSLMIKKGVLCVIFKNVLIILPQTKMLQRHLIKRCFYSRQL